ncbi:acetoacetate decarboxylase family protein [Staphylococcus equorum]|uniref:acetoacetate decarboxylase family protein n=1 Tax=Staphylococcus equorum TaxID=246432 RepID=UPI002DB99530|nr:acetoacetate decarboxylase family protein [Staphylococcus equorum]MEB8108669.1 acetoacetate decarboxylase family protein [Staphylococcus equorum]
MKKEDLKNIVTTPVNAPAFSPTNPFFKNREYVNVMYETDIEALKRVVPEPLEVTSNLIKFEIINMPDSTGLGSYMEAGQVIPVEYNGELEKSELTRSQITDFQIQEAYRSPVRLQLFEHVMAPLADFPVRKIVDGQHIIANLYLGRPKKIYDYLN